MSVAVVARRKATQAPGDFTKKKEARNIGRASYIVSIMGIVVGFIIIIAVVIFVSIIVMVNNRIIM